MALINRLRESIMISFGGMTTLIPNHEDVNGRPASKAIDQEIELWERKRREEQFSALSTASR